MSKKSVGDVLKNRIPEFQKGHLHLDGYLDAAGKFLGDTKECIENLANNHDYKYSTEFFYENTLTERGFKLPSRLKEDVKRRVLRDLSEINMKNGTVDGIIHAIRLAGLSPEIRVGWLPTPSEIRRGFIVDPKTGIESRYDVNRFIYTHMLYGDAVVEEDGVFFYGYEYNDSVGANRIGPLPIVGERYESVPEGYPVQKTPYILVRFTEGSSTLEFEPAEDPETGEVYEYSYSEEYELVNSVLEYFLGRNYRPTTIRVIVIVSMQPMEDNLFIDDSGYEFQVSYSPDGGDNLDSDTSVTDEYFDEFVAELNSEEDSLVMDDTGYSEEFTVLPSPPLVIDSDSVVIDSVSDEGTIRIEENLIGGYGLIGEYGVSGRFTAFRNLSIGEEIPVGGIDVPLVTEFFDGMTDLEVFSGVTWHMAGTVSEIQPLRGRGWFRVDAPTGAGAHLKIYGVKGTSDDGEKTLLHDVLLQENGSSPAYSQYFFSEDQYTYDSIFFEYVIPPSGDMAVFFGYGASM